MDTYIIARDKAGYCTSGQMNFHKPKARENDAYECNTSNLTQSSLTVMETTDN